MSRSRLIFLPLVAILLGLVVGPYYSTKSASLPGSQGPGLAPPLPSMYLLGSEVQISTPSIPIDANRHQPAVAYNYLHREFLVVWQNEWSGSWDIYAQRVSLAGQKVGSWFCITTGAEDRIQPAVAYNATNDEYLIVWMKEASSNVYEIWGRAIAWNNSSQKAEKQIITYPNRSFYGPRVAWNSFRNEYMVVWNAFDTTTGFPPGIPVDIAGARVSGNWSTIYTSNILTSDSGPHQVDITYNVAMNEYFVAFVVVHTMATSGNDIYGLRVNGVTGTPVNPPGPIVIYEDDFDGGRKHQNHPAVATNEQNKYMVVWEHEYDATDHDIYGREYNVNGTPVGSYFTISSWTEDDTVPALAAYGATNEWMAVWQRDLGSGAGYSIHGYRWGSGSPGVYSYLFDVGNAVFWEYKSPVVAAGQASYLIAYELKKPPAAAPDQASLATYQHIYGRIWWPEPVFLPLVMR
jgi:hypothetical protein